MSYKVIISNNAEKDIGVFRSEISVYNKIIKLTKELREHPRTGTGKPELMKYGRFKGLWSRRITGKNRLVYSINDNEIVVFVLSVKNHYEDK